MVSTRSDAHCPMGIVALESAPAIIKINALQEIYGEDAFKLTTLPYCCKTKSKQTYVPLIFMQGIADFLEGDLTALLAALTSVRHKRQHAVNKLGEDLVAHVILAIKEIENPASTQLSHTLFLAASIYDSLF